MTTTIPKGDFNRYTPDMVGLSGGVAPAKAYTMEMKLRKVVMAAIMLWEEAKLISLLGLQRPQKWDARGFVYHQLLVNIPAADLESLLSDAQNGLTAEVLLRLKVLMNPVCFRERKKTKRTPIRQSNANGIPLAPTDQTRSSVRCLVSPAGADRPHFEDQC